MAKSVCEENNFRTIFMQHAEGLRNFIYYKCGDLKQAEDISQDAFTKLWENCEKVVYEKAKSYLFTIANNTFLNQVKHSKVALKYRHQNVMSSKTHESPEFVLEEKEFRQKLLQAISALPEKQRVVFLMNRIDKLKYREIAEKLDISVKAVEKRMHNALKTLKEISDKL